MLAELPQFASTSGLSHPSGMMRGVGAPVPPSLIGEAEFYGFVDCLLQSRIRYDEHLRDGAQLLSDVEENVKFQAVNIPGPLLPLKTITFGLMPPPEREQQASWPQEKSFPRTIKLVLMPMRTRSHFMGAA